MQLSCLLLIISVACSIEQMRGVMAGDMFDRWKEWYQTKFKPCVQICPRHQEFVCGYDQNRFQYAVTSSLCLLQKHNACFNADYKAVPIEKCLNYLKFAPNIPPSSPQNFPLPVMVLLD
ncbi:hypothetical protein J6590_076976 [Homalodisca vitripennis]|nr:hypothetical protein J6590_076976 [Homalodisca vitripennis]